VEGQDGVITQYNYALNNTSLGNIKDYEWEIQIRFVISYFNKNSEEIEMDFTEKELVIGQDYPINGKDGYPIKGDVRQIKYYLVYSTEYEPSSTNFIYKYTRNIAKVLMAGARKEYRGEGVWNY
jgi:hypothetical protein